MAVESWFFEDNLKPFVMTIASLAGYEPDDDDDWLAIGDGLKDTDAERGRWLDWEFSRTRTIRLSLARDTGAGVVSIRCSADAETEGKIDLLTSVAQSYRLAERSGGWNG